MAQACQSELVTELVVVVAVEASDEEEDGNQDSMDVVVDMASFHTRAVEEVDDWDTNNKDGQQAASAVAEDVVVAV